MSVNANKNDERIIELKAQIEQKREEIKASQKTFKPITNCLIGMDGTTYNLHTCSKDVLQLLLIKLNMYRLSANDLGIGDFEMQMFKLSEWMTDIQGLLDMAEIKAKKLELAKAEKKLDTLLSVDKRTELELNNIEAMLKDN